MFSFGPLDIDVKVTGTVPDSQGRPSMPVGHQGATHVLEVTNLSMVPVDMEAVGALTARLLVFASGATWTKPLQAIPVHGNPPPSPSPINEPLLRPRNQGSGNETARCSQARWRNNGAPGWNPWHTPTSGNSVTLVVP